MRIGYCKYCGQSMTLETEQDGPQELLDEKENDAVREDIRKMDEAIQKLSEAADLLETEDD